MSSLEDYVDVDNEGDCAERMTDQEIAAVVLYDRKILRVATMKRSQKHLLMSPNRCLQPNKPFKLLIEQDDSLSQWTTLMQLRSSTFDHHIRAKSDKEKSIESEASCNHSVFLS